MKYQIRNVFLNGMQGTVRGQAITADGNQQSAIENFNISNSEIEAKSSGDLSYCSGWRFTGLSIKTPAGESLKVKNCTDMELRLLPSAK
ncbi:MAG: hypothetical protein U0X39_10280 [Bacteroidales bacterium]